MFFGWGLNLADGGKHLVGGLLPGVAVEHGLAGVGSEGAGQGPVGEQEVEGEKPFFGGLGDEDLVLGPDGKSLGHGPAGHDGPPGGHRLKDLILNAAGELDGSNGDCGAEKGPDIGYRPGNLDVGQPAELSNLFGRISADNIPA